MLNAEIYVTLKKTVADPQGLTIKHALHSLGHKEAKEVRMGKLVKITLDIKDKKQAEKELEGMCRKLLANPIIEEYSFVIKEE
ncbi:MAG: phosphoribosylformylglycinamidine synthase subunit PurS [Candidatus Omnitrophica bacterium]|nr:phosphoribosylformylglycinamidine synthase subunit PurS [Candidatus Omnitrophota bacterium]